MRKIKSFFSWVKRAILNCCRRSKPSLPEAPKPEIPQETVEVPTPHQEQVGSIAIIVGHNKKAQGAVNYLGESEFEFNSRIALKLKNKLEDFCDVHIIYRPSGSYSSQVRHVSGLVSRIKVQAVISLHFNSAGPRARGCEVLIPKTSSKLDNILADIITDALNENFNIKERHDDGVYEIPDNHRGAGMAYAIKRLGKTFCLVEPCFADTRTSESMQIFENEDKYVDVLGEAFLKFLAKL